MKGLRGINFRTLLEAKRGKMNVIMTFLAILELMKTGAIVIRQECIFGDIIVDSLEA
jgi:segregation and condensation protein A